MERKEVCGACIAYIHSNLTKQITLSDVVNAVYFSKSYVQHSFKKEMGLPIMQYVQKRKMELAKSLIEKGEEVSVVAKKLGYASYHRFRVRFRYYYGVSPLEIREGAL